MVHRSCVDRARFDHRLCVSWRPFVHQSCAGRSRLATYHAWITFPVLDVHPSCVEKGRLSWTSRQLSTNYAWLRHLLRRCGLRCPPIMRGVRGCGCACLTVHAFRQHRGAGFRAVNQARCRSFSACPHLYVHRLCALARLVRLPNSRPEPPIAGYQGQMSTRHARHPDHRVHQLCVAARTYPRSGAHSSA